MTGLAASARWSGERRPAKATLLGPLTGPGLMLAVALSFGVSGGLLWMVGYNYDGVSGGFVTKVHPSSYLIIVLFAWSVLVSGDPVGRGVHLAQARPASVLMIALSIALIAYIAARAGQGLGGIVDTYLASALLVLLLADADRTLMDRLETMLHLMMAANAALGLFEFVGKSLIFPYRFDGAVFASDTRSTALHGHPLANATVTACYLMALLTGSRALSAPVRLLMIGLQSAALVVFGGRTALLLAIVFGGGYGLWAMLASLRGGRVPILGAAAVIMGLAILPVALAGLWAAGFFDTMLMRFASDGGSANARKEMFELLKAFSLQDLIVGPDADVVETLRRINGLEWGIENPFVRMTLYQGAFMTFIVAVGFGLFMREIIREGHRGAWLPMVVWLVLVNGSESISTKTTLVSKFAVMMLCMYRRPALRAGAPGRAP